jgi:hypothetical protein
MLRPVGDQPIVKAFRRLRAVRSEVTIDAGESDDGLPLVLCLRSTSPSGGRRVAQSAIDSTGFECTAASGYFVRRRMRVSEPWKTMVYDYFAKLGAV